MSNDNKTLADVPPGGRVRLGDGLPPLPQMGYEARGTGMGPHDVYYTPVAYTAEQMRDYARATLSAQPSPGGQGGLNYERMFVDACAALAEVSRELGCDPEQGGAEPILAAIAELREALAARQPVGEPVAEAIEQLADDVESCVSDACGYLASDSGWDDYGIYRDDAAARYRALPDRIRALATPTAQAVDLADFKALYRAYVRLLESGRDRIRDLGGTCDPVDVMEANDVDLRAARRVMDSQAVGK